MTAVAPLHVRIRLFAMQREAAGTRELHVELPAGATVDDAWLAAVAAVPALASGRAYVRFAVNGAYADPDATLADGDEVACIPPVSGGSGVEAGADPADPRIRVLEIRPQSFPAGLAEELEARVATPQDGGVVTFVGRTRVSAGTPAPGQEAEAARHAGRDVEALDYEAFEPMAVEVLDTIADEIEARFGVRRIAILHRTGTVGLGEASVVIVAAAPHREAAFAAARYAIDETKARAPIWKAERFRDGHVWIGEPARHGAAERG